MSETTRLAPLAAGAVVPGQVDAVAVREIVGEVAGESLLRGGSAGDSGGPEEHDWHDGRRGAGWSHEAQRGQVAHLQVHRSESTDRDLGSRRDARRRGGDGDERSSADRPMVDRQSERGRWRGARGD
jgi:hypothetical protein